MENEQKMLTEEEIAVAEEQQTANEEIQQVESGETQQAEQTAGEEVQQAESGETQQAEQSVDDEAQQQIEPRKLTQEQKKAALEAVLFTVGESVEITRLADVIGENVKKTRKLLSALAADYEKENRGIMLAELENSYQLCSKPEFYDYLIKIAKAPRKYVLTDALLETLSIIAYKQPVTKVEIEKIRGVSSDHAVNRLVEFDLVCEVGRLDAPGRPILFGTTEQFLRSFGVKSLTELPEMNADRVAQFREEAEKEVQIKLDI